MSWKPRQFPLAIDRLLGRCVETPNGCWQYTGPTDRKGYVRLRRGDRQPGKVFGHRLTWEFFRGPIPDGLSFDHLCENTSCVNPWHGDLVPILVNIRRATRGTAVANRAKTHCPQGHAYTPDNLVASGRGRVCRACRNETNKRYRLRKKAAA